jgi:excisionase family DNA binding protein
MTSDKSKGPHLLDVAHAAEYLSVKERFVRRLVDEKRIPFHKVGRLVRFDQSDLDTFIQAGRVEPLEDGRV